MIELYDSAPEINDQQLALVEGEFDAGFPESYRSFLLTTNGGFPVEDCVVRITSEQRSKGRDVPLVKLSGVCNDDPTIDLRSNWNELAFGPLPKKYVAIADAGARDKFLLSLRPADYGAVYLWSPGRSRPELPADVTLNARKISDSFDAWCKTIVPKARKPFRKAPFFRRIETNSLDDVRGQLEKSPEAAETLDEDGQPAILVASRSPKMMKMLLEYGADPNVLTNGQIPVLSHPSIGVDASDLLIRYGADVDAADANGMTPLMHTVGQANVRKVRVLLDSGADPNSQDGMGRRVIDFVPLQTRGDKNVLPVIKQLLDAGADATEWFAKQCESLSATRGAIRIAHVFEKLGREVIVRWVDSEWLRAQLGKTLELKSVDKLGYLCPETEAAMKVLSMLQTDESSGA